MERQQLSPFPIENIYHVCVVVSDFDDALDDIRARLSIADWTSPVVAERTFRKADGSIVSTPVRAAFSVQGPPHLEFIEAHDEPNSLWPTGPGQRFDHIGVHVEDAAAEAQRLVAGGMLLEAEFLDPPRAGTGSHTSREVFYLRDPLGFRIELVDMSRRAHLRRWLAGETYPVP